MNEENQIGYNTLGNINLQGLIGDFESKQDLNFLQKTGASIKNLYASAKPAISASAKKTQVRLVK